VPAVRRTQLVARLLEFSDRLVIGVFNEHESERTTERFLEDHGLSPSGCSERPNRKKPGMRYRVLWIDSVRV
jgi:hypothetical protein